MPFTPLNLSLGLGFATPTGSGAQSSAPFSIFQPVVIGGSTGNQGGIASNPSLSDPVSAAASGGSGGLPVGGTPFPSAGSPSGFLIFAGIAAVAVGGFAIYYFTK